MAGTDESPQDIDGRAQAIAAWRDLIAALPDSAPLRLWLVDVDFADWPLEDPALLQAMTQWIRLPGRRMVWIGADFESLQRRCPRLAAWRRDYAHGIEAYRPAEGERVDWPSWLLAERTAVVLEDRSHWRGRRVTLAAPLREMREAADALLQRCEPAWPATVLGL
jgi:hypothetical protein